MMMGGRTFFAASLAAFFAAASAAFFAASSAAFFHCGLFGRPSSLRPLLPPSLRPLRLPSSPPLQPPPVQPLRPAASYGFLNGLLLLFRSVADHVADITKTLLGGQLDLIAPELGVNAGLHANRQPVLEGRLAPHLARVNAGLGGDAAGRVPGSLLPSLLGSAPGLGPMPPGMVPAGLTTTLLGLTGAGLAWTLPEAGAAC